MRYSSRVRAVVACALGLLALSPAPSARAAAVFSDSGDITDTVAAFQAALGEPNNGNNPGPITGGRREISWDGGGVSDAVDMPANQFAGRGVVFATPGTGFQISGADGNPANTAANEEFANINPSYSGLFSTFSPEKLFTAIGSNIVDVNFFIPGDTTTAANTIGFGAVFTDVDVADTSMIEFFDAADTLLQSEFVPVSGTAEEGLSFLGVTFDSAVVRRVRITSGNAALGGVEGDGNDLVVMDDFLYGEPAAGDQPPPVIPLPPAAFAALFAAGPAGLMWKRWKRG